MSTKLDLDASIIPKISAAGFKIEDSRELVNISLSNINFESLGLKIISTHVSNQICIVTSEGNREVIILNFSEKDILYQLLLFNGYNGLLWEDIRVGDKLSKVRKYFEIFYDDDGDELYYPLDPNIGVGFYITEDFHHNFNEETLGDDRDILIDGDIYLISVHNYDLIKNDCI